MATSAGDDAQPISLGSLDGLCDLMAVGRLFDPCDLRGIQAGVHVVEQHCPDPTLEPAGSATPRGLRTRDAVRPGQLTVVAAPMTPAPTSTSTRPPSPIRYTTNGMYDRVLTYLRSQWMTASPTANDTTVPTIVGIVP